MSAGIHFGWYTNVVEDVASADAATLFYEEVAGWTFETFETPSGPYHVARIGDARVGGVGLGQGPSRWLSYLVVDDVDARANLAVALGGVQLGPVMDIPNVGRFATIADPQGAAFNLFCSAGDRGPKAEGPGCIHWTELWAKDIDAVLPFYAALTGWSVIEMPMPDGTAYRIFMDGEDARAGGMSAPMPESNPMWLPWVHVKNVEDALEDAQNGGGSIRMPPRVVEAIGRLAIVGDANGAPIGLITPLPTSV